MKKLFAMLAVFSAIFAWGDRVEAVPITCIVCGNTPLSAAGIDGTISFAVISGQDFNNEVALHGIGFAGAVPGGSLDAVPNVTSPNDFVYLFQTVNTGPDPAPIQSYQVSLGIPPALLTGGGRLESTLFVDPALGGPVTAGPLGVTTGLSAGPTVDFLNGLGVGGFGPCQSSGGTADCSDATANLLPGAIQAINFAEAPQAPLLDPLWTSSIMWFSTRIGPSNGTATIFDRAGNSASGFVPTAKIPEPAAIHLFLVGLLGIGVAARRRLRKAA